MSATSPTVAKRFFILDLRSFDAEVREGGGLIQSPFETRASWHGRGVALSWECLDRDPVPHGSDTLLVREVPFGNDGFLRWGLSP